MTTCLASSMAARAARQRQAVDSARVLLILQRNGPSNRIQTIGSAAQRGGRGRATPAPNRLHNALADFGDSELVLAGLHENFHRARFLDTHFRRAAGVLDTLGWADVLSRGVHRRGDFALMKYLPAAALGIHAVVAAPERCAMLELEKDGVRS